MNTSLQEVQKVIKDDPAVENVIGFTGGGGATNTGNIYITLKPLNVRKIGAPEIINRIRPKLNRLPVASAFLQASQDLRIGGRGSNAMYQYTIQADNVDDLKTWGPRLYAEMKKLPGLQDVNSDQQNGGLDELVTFDRVTAAKLGQTAQSLDAGLYAAFGQSEVSLIYTQLNQYYVILEFAPQYWQNPQGLKDLYFHSGSASSTTSSGNTPIFTMAKAQANTTPLALNHTGLFPSVTVSFNLAPGAVAERCDDRDRCDAATPGNAIFGAWLLRRNAAGLSTIVEQRAGAGGDGADCGVHRAGRAVRELYASAHNHFYAAFRERRRDAGADALP